MSKRKTFEQINDGHIGFDVAVESVAQQLADAGWTVDDYTEERDYRLFLGKTPFDKSPYEMSDDQKRGWFHHLWRAHHDATA